MAVDWTLNDGGREAAGYKSDKVGDCVVRAIAIASGLDYQTVYDELSERQKAWAHARRTKAARREHDRKGWHVWKGVHPEVYKPYLAELGFDWTPIMKIGSGATVHLRQDELVETLPHTGRHVLRCSRHVTVWDADDQWIMDTYDPSRNGNRTVYGYWSAP